MVILERCENGYYNQVIDRLIWLFKILYYLKESIIEILEGGSFAQRVKFKCTHCVCK